MPTSSTLFTRTGFSCSGGAPSRQFYSLGAPIANRRVLNDLQYHLNRVLAERCKEHGVFMEVLGIGLLLTGNPAVGKSELALEFIACGHRLIADDAPEFRRIAATAPSSSSC